MKYLIPVAALVCAAIVLLFVLAAFLDSDPVEPVVNEPVPTASSSSQTTETPPLTLEYLQSQPGWNPTQSMPGIERIEPSELTLFDSGVDLTRKPVPRTTDSTEPFEIVMPDSNYTSENCIKFNIEENRCPPYGPEIYTEFAILAKESNEVILAYRLLDNYSLIREKGISSYGGGIGFSLTTESFSFSLDKWVDFSGDKNSTYTDDRIIYWLNPYTGELRTKR